MERLLVLQLLRLALALVVAVTSTAALDDVAATSSSTLALDNGGPSTVEQLVLPLPLLPWMMPWTMEPLPRPSLVLPLPLLPWMLPWTMEPLPLLPWMLLLPLPLLP
jgi:hypothetical protein